MQATVLLKVKRYLQSVKPLFINWQIRLVYEHNTIKITYKDAFIDFIIKEKLTDDKKAYKQVVFFCFDAFYYNEWNGRPMNSEELGKLLDLQPGQVRRILHNIYKKLNEYWQPILSEK